MGLFSDLVAWLVESVPELRIINILDNTVYYMTMPLAAYSFWLYVISVMGIEDEKEKLVSRVMKYGLIGSLFLCFLNIFLGFYFTVDDAGVYSRAEAYPISMIYAFVTTGVTLYLILKIRKKLQVYQFIALILYVSLPTLIGIITMFSYGLSLNYGVIMIVLLLMYCVINITQGRNKVVADRDLMMASKIQESFLPHIFPPFPKRSEFDLFAIMDAAKEVGGDFYDFFLTDEDHICLVIADVSGKGVPASLFMMISKILIKSHIQAGESPGEALEKVNNILLDGNTTEMFVTVWIGLIEISTGKGIAVNAGHEHPILRRADGEFELIKYRHSPAVSTMEDIPFREHEFELHPGDSLFVYTDGVAEATNSENEAYGAERMLKALNSTLKDNNGLTAEGADPTPEELVTTVRKDLDIFVNGATQFDDITMLCFNFKGVSE